MKGAQAFLQGFIFGNGYGAAASRSGGSALATLRARATGVWVELDGAAGFGKRGWTVIQHPGAGHIGSNRKVWTARRNDDWFQFGHPVAEELASKAGVTRSANFVRRTPTGK